LRKEHRRAPRGRPGTIAAASSSDDLAGRPRRASVRNGAPMTLRQGFPVLAGKRSRTRSTPPLLGHVHPPALLGGAEVTDFRSRPPVSPSWNFSPIFRFHLRCFLTRG